MYNFDIVDIGAYKDIMEAGENANMEVVKTFTGFTMVSEDRSRLSELAMGIVYDRAIILSRIFLERRRVGTMTKIFNLSLDLCKKYNTRKFIVQSVVTPEMASWCASNKMLPMMYSSYEQDGVIYGDYSLDIHNL